jgi:hypothetical protein
VEVEAIVEVVAMEVEVEAMEVGATEEEAAINVFLSSLVGSYFLRWLCVTNFSCR